MNGLGTLVKINQAQIYDFWILNAYLMVYLYIFMPVLHSFNHCSFVVGFKIGKYIRTLQLCSFEYCSAYLESLVILYKFVDQLFQNGIPPESRRVPQIPGRRMWTQPQIIPCGWRKYFDVFNLFHVLTFICDPTYPRERSIYT